MRSLLRPDSGAAGFRRLLPPLLVLACAAAYVGIDLWYVDPPTEVTTTLPPFAHALLVVLQAAALLFRRRAPISAFSAVVLCDLAILITSAGELGIGSLGVAFGAYAVARAVPRRRAWAAITAGALATTVIGGAAMLLGSTETLAVLLVTAVARIALTYLAPAALAEYALSRSRLDEALREQARLREAERRDRAERAVHAARNALARELHDVAGHYLSGIIVSAQAASALAASDPERAREMMQTVQDDARTTLADLRRTVGLLRSDDADASSSSPHPSPMPSIAGVADLVAAAGARGQQVELITTGDPQRLGPLAETAAYRTVQESLANAARHAPGAQTTVRVVFASSAVEITVSNTRAAKITWPDSSGRRDGYGLAGMAERADLIGARLSTGPSAHGGWTNRLSIPIEKRSPA